MKKAVFNSVGSNYNLSFALKALFAGSSTRHTAALKTILSDRYNGEAHLFYKGREAIQAALVIAQLPEGSAVLITGYTCFAVYQAVIDASCKPVFVDIAHNDSNFTVDTLKTAYQKNPEARALIVQNTLGFGSEIGPIVEFAKVNKLLVIEDLAHCIGLQYSDGTEAGTKGDFAALSFSQDKVVDGISGGALLVRNSKYQNKLKDLVQYSKLPIRRQLTDRIYPIQTVTIRALYPFKIGKIQHELAKRFGLLAKPVDGVFGTFRTLPSWYCGLIVSQFKKLPSLASHRLAISEVYKQEISEKFHITSADTNSIYLRFPIKVSERDSLFSHLMGDSTYITDIWYESTVAPIRYLPKTSYVSGECPQAERLAAVMVNLPTHQGVSLDDARRISRKVEAWLLKAEK